MVHRRFGLDVHLQEEEEEEGERDAMNGYITCPLSCLTIAT